MNNELGEPRGMWGEGRGAYSVWWGDLKKIDHLKDLGVDGNIILKLIFKKWDSGHRLD